MSGRSDFCTCIAISRSQELYLRPGHGRTNFCCCDHEPQTGSERHTASSRADRFARLRSGISCTFAPLRELHRGYVHTQSQWQTDLREIYRWGICLCASRIIRAVVLYHAHMTCIIHSYLALIGSSSGPHTVCHILHVLSALLVCLSHIGLFRWERLNLL